METLESLRSDVSDKIFEMMAEKHLEQYFYSVSQNIPLVMEELASASPFVF
jgi:hypothetical protein